MTGSENQPANTTVSGGDAGYVVTRAEERMRVTTETVPVARIRVRKRLVTEQQTFTVPVTREEITLDYEDIPEHDQTPDGTGPLTPDDVEVIRYEERVVITKQFVAVERVRLVRRVVTVDHTVVGQVHRELVDIDQLGSPGDDTSWNRPGHPAPPVHDGQGGCPSTGGVSK